MPTTLSDEELLESFESCEIPHNEWTHQAHVRVAYLYLRRHGTHEGLSRIRSGIKALNAAHGTPDSLERGYHETITVAFVRLISKALSEDDRCSTSAELCERHPELLSKAILDRFYSQNRLISTEAKAGFVEPDLMPLPD